jgi:FixJ family two-component response regulator
VLTDVIMPGMSGRQLADQVAALRPSIKIVYMTGYTDDMVVHHRILEPGIAVLQKPFTRQQLGAKVRAALDSASDEKSLGQSAGAEQTD